MTTTRARTKSPESFEEIPTDHLKCRSLRHPWDPRRTVVTRIERKKAYVTRLVCLRCGTEKPDIVFVTTGERVASGYSYADGYLIKDRKSWGDAKTFNANVRLELYGRLAKNGMGGGRHG